MYVTSTEFRERIGENRFLALVDRDADGNEDSAAVVKALKDASSTADMFITRYLPISASATIPDALQRIVSNLAVYELAGDHATELEREKADVARKDLASIQAKKAHLALPDGSSSSSATSHASLEGPEAEFTRSQTGAIQCFALR